MFSDKLNTDTQNSISAAIEITGPVDKLLVIGQTGCGKSVALKQVAENLADRYHIVFFSAADILNPMDIEIVDILLAAYLESIRSLRANGIKGLPKSFAPLMKRIKPALNISAKSGFDVLESLSFKLRVESEARMAVREAFGTETAILGGSLTETCRKTSELLKKDVILIVDDLDKLAPRFVEDIFFRNADLLTLPEIKMIFAFPLSHYYMPMFEGISEKFAYELVTPVCLQDIDGKRNQAAYELLADLALGRIEGELVHPEALRELTEKSGGLVRDLMKFMKDACKIAVNTETGVIDETVAERVINMKIGEFDRFFDFPKYGREIGKILKTRFRNDVVGEDMVHLLRYNFVLKYGHEDEQSWYDVHPCLKECVTRKNKIE